MRTLLLTCVLGLAWAMPALAQNRFPPIAPEQMTPEQRALAAAIQGGPRAAVPGRDNAIGGPFNPWLRSPATGDLLQQLGAQLRFRTSIPAALNEFAILITAREWSSQYEWFAHHRLAMAAGLPASVAADLAQGRRPEGMDEDTRIVWEFCTELHRNRFVSDATFEAAKARFGERGVIDLIAVSGYYVTVAMTLNTARVGLPEGVAPPLPELRR
ncbi:carboxymuconolactone decarboxylase family protein [Plastoroseomonas arctica]|uniref:Carboxymuconolactone decarboxylase family protein n=1 Tax=Plastoroseomonas arctica TaxID=1509237 RepID=A0AAF1K6V7_9PROT|nr:carboxymuconolactone decarboxylase family protein [Plastoroseomonas arctica]MBR0656811.1 carboxymuconolactone decarboxylase family protein [Plastoroseomonas arctica]